MGFGIVFWECATMAISKIYTTVPEFGLLFGIRQFLKANVLNVQYITS